jgi:predicted N-acyltransferase
MPDGTDAVAIKVIKSLSEVSPEAWDACAGSDNPFVRHAFLSALEESGSATAETGWLGQHLLIEDPAGGLAACAPLYLKNHSYGEYVFDWAGPTPGNAPAEGIIPSCNVRCRSPR